MMDFSEEQKRLLEKPTIVIMPAFDGEWVIEVYSSEDDLVGRLNVADEETAVGAIRAALTDRNDPPHFEPN